MSKRCEFMMKDGVSQCQLEAGHESDGKSHQWSLGGEAAWSKVEFHVSDPGEAIYIIHLEQAGYVVYKKNCGFALVTDEFRKELSGFTGRLKGALEKKDPSEFNSLQVPRLTTRAVLDPNQTDAPVRGAIGIEEMMTKEFGKVQTVIMLNSIALIALGLATVISVLAIHFHW